MFNTTPRTALVLSFALFAALFFAPADDAGARGTWMPIFDDMTTVARVDLGDGTRWIQPVADKAELESVTGETAVVETLAASLQDLGDVQCVRIDGHYFIGTPELTLDSAGLSVHNIGSATLTPYDDASFYTRP